MSKPTVLIVHGSWHGPAFFDRTRSLFEQAGHEVHTPSLPSIHSGSPSVGLLEDAHVVTSVLDALIERESKEVIVIAHSYAGVVVSEAVAEAYGLDARKKAGKKGGVRGILYVCAFLLTIGESVVSVGNPAPYLRIDEFGMSTTVDSKQVFYNDLPPDEADYWVSQLVPCASLSHITPLSHAGYLYHPVTYLFCENDQAISLEVQKRMVDNVEGKTGVKFKKSSCAAGHSPFLSKPEEVVKVAMGI